MDVVKRLTSLENQKGKSPIPPCFWGKIFLFAILSPHTYSSLFLPEDGSTNNGTELRTTLSNSSCYRQRSDWSIANALKYLLAEMEGL